MQTLDDCLYFASNIDVLTFLHGQEQAQRDRVQRAIKFRTEQYRDLELSVDEESERRHIVPDDLRSIQYEVTRYLTQDTLPQSRQSVLSSQTLVRSLLERFPELTKLERLQLINIPPSNYVELYSIVPNFDERIPGEERLQELLSLCQLSLSNNTLFEEDDGTNQADPSAHSTSIANNVTEEGFMPEMTNFELQELQEENALVDEGGYGGSRNNDLELDENPD